LGDRLLSRHRLPQSVRVTGTIDRVEIDVSGEPFIDPEAEGRGAITAQ
jgi:hypothetical protein